MSRRLRVPRQHGSTTSTGRTRVLGWALLACATTAAGAEGPALLQPDYRMDVPTLQRGARLFVQNCMVCHSLRRMRVSRVGADLGLSPEQLRRDYLFAAGQPLGEGLAAAMAADIAKTSMGAAPPDLSTEARYRGPAWVYSYLLGFYEDRGRSLGWNNHYFPDVAMPNALAGLGGVRDAEGKLMSRGRLSEEEFRAAVADITAWLDYASDPSVLERHRMGPYVLAFLALFTGLAWWTKRVFWKDVH